jgi:hypothetical protein
LKLVKKNIRQKKKTILEPFSVSSMLVLLDQKFRGIGGCSVFDFAMGLFKVEYSLNCSITFWRTAVVDNS